MDNKRLYVDFHIIQTVPPSCINRDDIGRPKTAVYGGAVRSRVSSQSWKHAMRAMFSDIFGEDNQGFRTKHAVKLIADKIQVKDVSISAEEAEKKAAKALNTAGIKTNEKKDNQTGALFFISAAQADKLADLTVAGSTDKKEYQKALNDAPSVDIALFGRMVADNPELNADASCQVAHSISTHAVQNEYDYFTAVDDCSPADNAGAGHLGTMEFNAATLYRYATVNVLDLKKYLENDTAQAVRGFAESFIRSMPTGKQNSYANRTLPATVYVTIRRDQPINLCGAFEKPIVSAAGYEGKSSETLFEYAEQVYADYCGEPVQSFILGKGETNGAQKVNLRELLEKLQEYVANEVE